MAKQQLSLLQGCIAPRVHQRGDGMRKRNTEELQFMIVLAKNSQTLC